MHNNTIYSHHKFTELAVKDNINKAQPQAGQPGTNPEGNLQHNPREQHILSSWQDNAQAWTAAIREGRIASRERVTNDAVLEAVMSGRPRTVLDLGCGEGWLVRALAKRGVAGTGLDATDALVDRARELGGGEFRRCSYAAFASSGWPTSVDAVVFNFSLLGEELQPVLTTAGRALNPGGRCVIQTLHPAFACPEDGYVDGWRSGSWQGFDGGFCNPAPWYFRTLESWIALLDSSNLHLVALREPLDPSSRRPLSLVLIAAPAPAGL